MNDPLKVYENPKYLRELDGIQSIESIENVKEVKTCQW